MKRGGIMNSNLAGFLARLGHTDLVVVCGACLSIPPGAAVVDLAFRFCIPSFEIVLSDLLEELIIEGATAAEEIDQNPASRELLESRFPDLGLVPH